MQRPDLSQTDPAVLAYIEMLEAEIEQLRTSKQQRSTTTIETPPPEPNEPPTSVNVITISRQGLLKRTPRHLYGRQRRSGMGIFDLDGPQNDPPAQLIVADEDEYLFCLTTEARTFRLRVNRLPESPIRSRGQDIKDYLPLHEGEQPIVMLPEQTQGYVIILTERGHVRRFRHHYFGKSLRSGLVLYELKDLGRPVAGCWSTEEAEIFIATREGRGIRFAENQIPARGCLGIRLGKNDTAVAITPVTQNSGVFMATDDGKGAIRLMSGFTPNKAPGSGGKVAMKTDNLIGAFQVNEGDDIFIISRLSKIIRFQAIEVPPKEGAVQGVNCMALRADECVATARAILTS